MALTAQGRDAIAQGAERAVKRGHLGGEVRCRNPKCKAKLAESLAGTLTVTCRKCGLVQTIVITVNRSS